MKRAYATAGIPDVECTNSVLGLWRIRWDFEPVKDEGNENLVSFLEYQFDHKPTLRDVKDIIIPNSSRIFHDWGVYESYLNQL